MITEKEIEIIIEILSKEYKPNKLISSMDEADDPYKLLISCLLSLRTKDETTYPAAKRLFELAKTPEEMLTIDPQLIEKTIYPVGFYNNKTQTILEVSRILIEKYDKKVPSTMEELLSIRGIGRKTANLVLARGFNIPAICVDTHVHRISNRLGYVKTKDPTETEMELRKKLPQKLWFKVNTALIRHGQEVCKPINPKCDICPINKYCAKIITKPKKK